MTTGLRGYRFVVIVGISLLFLLLVTKGFGLFFQLRVLATAEDDNTQWSISQLEVEFANLEVALTQASKDSVYNDREINLRLDIALSRLGVLTSGHSTIFFETSDTAQSLIASVNDFAAQAIELADQPGPLTAERVSKLGALTSTVRPNVRKIALLGVDIDAARSDAQRGVFAGQLFQAGGTTIALLLLMGVLLVLLDRLLIKSARRDAEILASSRLLESTISASLDAIVTANEHGEIIEYNAAAVDVFGWTRDEIIGETMENTFIPGSMREAHHAGMKRYLTTGVPRVIGAGRVELSALRKTGEEFPIELNITSVVDENGTKFVAYIRDISEGKINEQKLIDARDRAEQTDKAKSQFLTVMSHEMRTPLNGIMGVLDLLRTTKLSEKQDRYARIAAASSEILLGHANEALDITRIETDSFHLSPQNFDLSDLMTALIDVLEPLAREKQLGMSLQIDDTMRTGFFGDGNRIRQILTNLVGNAIKFTSTGSIAIEVKGIHGASETSLRISVTDTGAGIDPEQYEQIFEDFIALSNSKGRQSRGDGLGLSISRRIARKLGGDIAVTSEIDVGSTFTLTVPLKRQDIGQQEKIETQTPQQIDNVQSMRILIVEDNNINRNVLRDMLEGLGHEVTESVNGADCLEQANIQRFDMIFMDISMPVMDGIEATKRLRAGQSLNFDTHIVGLTAHGHEEYREKGDQAGMSRFHTKPIRLNALHAILSDAHEVVSSHVKSDVEMPQELPLELAELSSMLGKDKVQHIVGTFFDELQEFLADLDAGAPASELDLAEATHKQKGAASMLGQHDLATRLADLEDLARQGSVTELTKWSADLKKLSVKAKAAFAASI